MRGKERHAVWRGWNLSKNGLEHLVGAARNSVRGLCAAMKEETAFRQECCVLAGIVIAVSAVSGLTPQDKALLIGAWLCVMSVELLNTAIECVFDLVSKDFHPLIKKGKDTASAAIFIMIGLNVLLWAGYAAKLIL
jgi:diacylglycerol kinase (ATP)